MGAQRSHPAPKPDQPASAELLSVWVGGYGAAGLQPRLIFERRCCEGGVWIHLRTVVNITTSANENSDVYDVPLLLVCKKTVLMVLVLVSVSSQSDLVSVSNGRCGFEFRPVKTTTGCIL